MRIFPFIPILMFALLLSCSDSNDDVSSDGDTEAPDGDSIVGDGDENPDGDMEPDGDSEDETPVDGDPDSDPEEDAPPLPLEPEAGFMPIESVSYFIRRDGLDEVPLKSSKARLWYVFQPAEENPDEKPLFIFFNGGPGSATGLLFGFNTSHYTLDPAMTDGAPYVENPHSWTRLGNLLYVDARQTGFSHGLLEKDIDVEDVRSDEFTAKNFNCLFDGADFVRLLLRFIGSHPQLKDNQVVIAGESYGGIRATVMLQLLLFYSEYGDGSRMYKDPALAAEIQTHVDEVFPEYAGAVAPPEVMARQFGYQVLIQPLLSGKHQDDVAGELWEQDDSPLFRIAAEEGLQYVPCRLQADPDCDPHDNGLMFLLNEAERDIYNYSQPYNWMNDVSDEVTAELLILENLKAVTMFDLETVEELYAENRADVYRRIRLPEDRKSLDFVYEKWMNDPRIPFALRLLWQKKSERTGRTPGDLVTGDLDQTFGALQPWDQFYMSIHEIVNAVFYLNDLIMYEIDPFQTVYGDLFLENLLYAHTFITHAAYDMIIYADALPGALERHTEQVQNVLYQEAAIGGEERPGRVTVTYKENAFAGVASGTERSFRFPDYSNSCHAVEITEPEGFLYDVETWLSEAAVE